MRLSLGLGLAALVLAVTPAAAATRPCFDVAVVGRITQETPAEFTRRPGEIIMSWTWYLDIEIDKTLVGPDLGRQLTVTKVLHNGIVTTPYVLMFLKYSPRAKHYDMFEEDLRVVKDDRDRFVIPMAGPFSKETVARRFIPKEYKTMLRPVRYPPDSAWWLKGSRLDTIYVPTTEADPALRIHPDAPAGAYAEIVDMKAYPWGRFTDGVVTADRGLYLDDLVPAFAKHQCKR